MSSLGLWEKYNIKVRDKIKGSIFYIYFHCMRRVINTLTNLIVEISFGPLGRRGFLNHDLDLVNSAWRKKPA